MGEDKFELLEMPTHKIITMTHVEEKNVMLNGKEEVLSLLCCMICESRSCVGFSTTVNSTNSCLLYSKVEFARVNATEPALAVNEKLYMR